MGVLALNQIVLVGLDDEDACEDDGCSGWFSADNLVVVLQRRKKPGIRIFMPRPDSLVT